MELQSIRVDSSGPCRVLLTGHVLRLARVYVSHAYNDDYYRRIRAEAAARGTDDIARASSRLLGRSRVIRRLMPIPDWLNRKTALWRAAGPIRRAAPGPIR